MDSGWHWLHVKKSKHKRKQIVPSLLFELWTLVPLVTFMTFPGVYLPIGLLLLIASTLSPTEKFEAMCLME